MIPVDPGLQKPGRLSRPSLACGLHILSEYARLLVHKWTAQPEVAEGTSLHSFIDLQPQQKMMGKSCAKV